MRPGQGIEGDRQTQRKNFPQSEIAAGDTKLLFTPQDVARAMVGIEKVLNCGSADLTQISLFAPNHEGPNVSPGRPIPGRCRDTLHESLLSR